MRQPCSSRRLVLTLDRATAKVSAISSAGSGWGERNNSACTWATVRLMPQRVPISPQWRMNFWATGVREFGDVLVCTLISVMSLYSEITKTTVRLSRAEVLANDQLFARFKKISCGSATGRGNGSEDEICPRLQAACG